MEQVDYDIISKVYDDVRESDIKLINQFLKELPTRGRLNILDIGCGTGNYTDQFQKIMQGHGCMFYGVDPSEAMLNKAREKNKFVKYQVGEAEKIPLPDSLFDFVYMTDVIHHVSEIHKMFAEIHRVLKVGGKACIVTQSHAQIGHRPIAQFFPATIRIDESRYPDIRAITGAAEHNGLIYLKKEIMFEGEEIELGADFLELVQKKGYSMLHLLSEQEYQMGLHAVEDALKNGPVTIKSAGETLIWFVKEVSMVANRN